MDMSEDDNMWRESVHMRVRILGCFNLINLFFFPNWALSCYLISHWINNGQHRIWSFCQIIGVGKPWLTEVNLVQEEVNMIAWGGLGWRRRMLWTELVRIYLKCDTAWPQSGQQTKILSGYKISCVLKQFQSMMEKWHWKGHWRHGQSLDSALLLDGVLIRTSL